MMRAFLFGTLTGLVLTAALVALDMRDEYTTIFVPGHLNRFIDPLYPPGRFKAPEDNAQEFDAEPGYADILVPRGYRKIHIKLQFENPSKQEFSIGLRRYAMPDLVSVTVDKEFETTLATAGADVNGDGRMTLIFSAPEMRLKNPQPINLQKLIVTFQDPIWKDQSLFQRIFWYLHML